MDGAPFMPDRQIATRDLREHSRNGETVSNSEFVNSLLDKKTGVLQQYKNRGYSSVLLIESSDFVLSSRVTILKAVCEAYRSETDGPVFDQIYIATTGANPWCIVPFKVGSEIMNKPKPYWPTAPGYSLGIL